MQKRVDWLGGGCGIFMHRRDGFRNFISSLQKPWSSRLILIYIWLGFIVLLYFDLGWGLAT